MYPKIGLGPRDLQRVFFDGADLRRFARFVGAELRVPGDRAAALDQ